MKRMLCMFLSKNVTTINSLVVTEWTLSLSTAQIINSWVSTRPEQEKKFLLAICDIAVTLK